VQQIFDKWDIHCEQIGEVTTDGRLKYYMGGELVADVPAESLVLGGGAPVYKRESKEPKYFEQVKAFNQNSIPVPADLKATAEKLVQLPTIASKRWVYEQYDSMVGTGNTQTNEPSDAPVVRVHGSTKGIACTTDCNSRYVFADPYKGAMIAVSEAARNIVCSGGDPVAITNCLNFGNPYNPEVYYQFEHAIKGMGDACRKLGTPVTGGNVSFYNQSSDDGPVYPTPTIGMVGVLDTLDQKMTMFFRNAGDIIYVIGENREDINSSEYLHKLCNVEYSPAPYFDMEEEYQLQKLVLKLARGKEINSAHDVSEGGLFTTLLECCFKNNLGFTVSTDPNIRKDAWLFGEGQSRVVVSVSHAEKHAFEQMMGGHRYVQIGEVTSDGTLTIDDENWGSITEWKEKYDTAIDKLMNA